MLKNERGETFLHIASSWWRQYQRAIEKASYSFGGSNGASIMDSYILQMRTNSNAQASIIQMLLQCGARIDIQNKNGEYSLQNAVPLYLSFIVQPFTEAIKKNDMETIKTLMLQGLDLNKELRGLGTLVFMAQTYPLFLAAHAENETALKLFLDQGADPLIVTFGDAGAEKLSLLARINQHNPATARCIAQHVPLCDIRKVWNNVALPWLLISKRLTVLPKDMRNYIANTLVLDAVMIKLKERSIAYNKCLSSPIDYAAQELVWRQACSKALKNRPQKLCGALLPAQKSTNDQLI